MPVGEGVWRVWRVLECLEGCGLGPGVPACCGRCVGGLEGFGGFGEFWRVLEGLRPGKRQL